MAMFNPDADSAEELVASLKFAQGNVTIALKGGWIVKLSLQNESYAK